MTDSVVPFRPSSGLLVAPLELRLIAEINQSRVGIAEQAVPQLHGLRARLNEVQHELGIKAGEVIDIQHEIVGSEVPQFVSPFGWWPKVLIPVMLILELPVNKAALDFLRLPQFESYALAIFFALVNFAAAKSTARVIRQEPFSLSNVRPWAIAFITNLALLYMIFRVAELRSLEASLTTASWTFFALQLAFYLATLFLSYLTIAPSAEDEQLSLRLTKGRAALRSNWRKHAKVAKVYNRLRETTLLRIAKQEEAGLADVAEYRDHNLRARSDAGPSWFSSPIPRTVWRPIDIGEPVDEHPEAIRALINEVVRKKGA